MLERPVVDELVVDEHCRAAPVEPLRRYVAWYTGYRQRGVRRARHRGLGLSGTYRGGGCTYCGRNAENLCPQSLYTGLGLPACGYAEYMTAPAAYAHRRPQGYTHAELAPLLCAGIIGYHALQRAELVSRPL